MRYPLGYGMKQFTFLTKEFTQADKSAVFFNRGEPLASPICGEINVELIC